MILRKENWVKAPITFGNGDNDYTHQPLPRYWCYLERNNGLEDKNIIINNILCEALSALLMLQSAEKKKWTYSLLLMSLPDVA